MTTKTRREALAEAKLVLARALNDIGVDVNEHARTDLLRSLATEHITPPRQAEDPVDYFLRAANTRPRSKPDDGYTGEIVQRYMPDLLHRPAWHWPEHPNPRAQNLMLPRQVSLSNPHYRALPEFLR